MPMSKLMNVTLFLFLLAPVVSFALPGEKDKNPLLFPPGDEIFEESPDKTHYCSTNGREHSSLDTVLDVVSNLNCDDEKKDQKFCRCVETTMGPLMTPKERKEMDKEIFHIYKRRIAADWKEDMVEWHQVQAATEGLLGIKLDQKKCGVDDLEEAVKADQGNPNAKGEECSPENLETLKKDCFIDPRKNILTFKDFDEGWKVRSKILKGDFQIPFGKSGRGGGQGIYSYEEGLKRMQEITEDELSWVMEAMHGLEKNGVNPKRLQLEDLYPQKMAEDKNRMEKIFRNHPLIQWLSKKSVVKSKEEVATPMENLASLYFHLKKTRGRLAEEVKKKGGTVSDKFMSSDLMEQFFNDVAPARLDKDCDHLKEQFIKMCRRFPKVNPHHVAIMGESGHLKRARNYKLFKEAGWTKEQRRDWKKKIDRFYCSPSPDDVVTAAKEDPKTEDFLDLLAVGRKGFLDREDERQRLDKFFGLSGIDSQSKAYQSLVGKDGKINFNQLGVANSQGIPVSANGTPLAPTGTTPTTPATAPVSVIPSGGNDGFTTPPQPKGAFSGNAEGMGTNDSLVDSVKNNGTGSPSTRGSSGENTGLPKGGEGWGGMPSGQNQGQEAAKNQDNSSPSSPLNSRISDMERQIEDLKARAGRDAQEKESLNNKLAELEKLKQQKNSEKTLPQPSQAPSENGGNSSAYRNTAPSGGQNLSGGGGGQTVSPAGSGSGFSSSGLGGGSSGGGEESGEKNVSSSQATKGSARDLAMNPQILTGTSGKPELKYENYKAIEAGCEDKKGKGESDKEEVRKCIVEELGGPQEIFVVIRVVKDGKVQEMRRVLKDGKLGPVVVEKGMKKREQQFKVEELQKILDHKRK